MSRTQPWIWAQPSWPDFRFDLHALAPLLARAYQLHGQVEGLAQAIGLEPQGPLVLESLADEAIATAAIEGEHLVPDAVRSSVMRRLGLASGGPADRHIDGLVAVVGDAHENLDAPLDDERLWRWQAALFPAGSSGLRRIAVGRYRDHADPMQIVSGPPGRETIHYEAPPSAAMQAEMQRFLVWFNATAPSASPGDTSVRLEGLVRAGLAHLWFESIHPFEDGNGRIGRALIDRALSQHLRPQLRLYSVSKALLSERAGYYEALNQAQRSEGEVTPWLQWFVTQCTAAFQSTLRVIEQALEKQRFWQRHAALSLNERQRKLLQRLLDAGDGGFLGGLNAEKAMKITGASKATATRDLSALVQYGLLWTHGTGKALRYYVAVQGWGHGVSEQARGMTEPR